MTDKKKNNNEETADKTVIKNEEITDDQANKASGGGYHLSVCRKDSDGMPSHTLNGQPRCYKCHMDNKPATGDR